jgi:hypothetical protein
MRLRWPLDEPQRSALPAFDERLRMFAMVMQIVQLHYGSLKTAPDPGWNTIRPTFLS